MSLVPGTDDFDIPPPPPSVDDEPVTNLEPATESGTSHATSIDDSAGAPVIEGNEGEDEKETVSSKDEEADEEEEATNKSRLWWVVLLLIIFFILGAGVALLFVVFRTPSTTASVLLDNDTKIDVSIPPTLIPSTSPTFGVSTLAPTQLPTTNSPTRNPTLPPVFLNGEISRLSCEDIRNSENATKGNLGNNNFIIETLPDGSQKCGDTYGPDPIRPNRNSWSIRIGRRDCPKFTYNEGISICDTVGARWCHVSEFLEQVGLGTGCGGDREFVYTDTNCFDVDNNNKFGKVMFDVGLRATRDPFFFCESNLTRKSIARCCGDVF